jgi:hypothetical protein
MSPKSPILTVLPGSAMNMLLGCNRRDGMGLVSAGIWDGLTWYLVRVSPIEHRCIYKECRTGTSWIP